MDIIFFELHKSCFFKDVELFKIRSHVWYVLMFLFSSMPRVYGSPFLWVTLYRLGSLCLDVVPKHMFCTSFDLTVFRWHAFCLTLRISAALYLDVMPFSYLYWITLHWVWMLYSKFMFLRLFCVCAILRFELEAPHPSPTCISNKGKHLGKMQCSYSLVT
jgi:hypothetical protein